ncbi:MAG TPA: hypothetical protein VHY79_18205 [Rhizomicrobium sp.]|nr:hypothetical protein [Rhizomicrobium sp.]
MNANQPHIGVAGNTKITFPLDCGTLSDGTTVISDGTVIQGSPALGVAEDKNILPPFLITADNTNGGFDPIGSVKQAMLIMPPNELCAIHAVGLIADGKGVFNTVNANGKNDLIADHSYLYGGYNNLDTSGSVSGNNAGLQVYDSSLAAATNDNAYITTSNIKLVRNSFAGAGADNIHISGLDNLIADNIIQQAQGWGITASGATLVRVTGNFFDDNGKGLFSAAPAAGAILINNSADMTICSNTFSKSGAGSEGMVSGVTPVITSHIFFKGDDSISLCGNVYYPSVSAGAPIVGLLRPDYDYDADPGATLTNITIADNPAAQNIAAAGTPQNLGVFLPNAAILLSASVNPQVARNSLTGLIMSNGSTGTKVTVGAGSTADSTNSATISLPAGCSVDLDNTVVPHGLGGLDVGTVQTGTTYYIFAVFGPGGAAPNCMASKSKVPSFQNVSGANVYTLTQTANTLSGSPIIFNAGGNSEGVPAHGPSINPLAGFAVGYEVSGANLPSCSPSCARIQSLSSYQLATTGTWGAGSATLTVNSVTGVSFGMSVSDGTANDMYIPQGGTSLPNGNYVIGIDGSGTPSCTGTPHCVTIFGPTTAGTGGSSKPVYFGGSYTVGLDSNASASTALGSPTTIHVHAGLYRMIGAIYTDPSDTNIIPFTQDGDTFYLNTPVADINTTIGNSDTPITLAGVPLGIAVQWLGRCVSSGKVIVYSLGTSPGQPVAFPAVPGFDVSTGTGSLGGTAARYQAYTDTSAKIHARANSTGTSFECMTDGWIWHRGR